MTTADLLKFVLEARTFEDLKRKVEVATRREVEDFAEAEQRLQDDPGWGQD